MKKPVLALIPSAYKTDKVYSVLPVNGDGDFSFYRDTGGTRIKENGLIEEITTANKPRLNWEGNCPSLLMEGTSRNLQIRSEEFDNSAWGKIFINVTANDTISPDGTESADKLQRTNTDPSFIYDSINVGYGQKTFTNSIFVKKGEGNFLAIRTQGSSAWVDLRFNFLTKQIISYTSTSFFTAISSKVEEFDNGWFRIYFTYTTDGYNILSHSYSPRFTEGDIDDTDGNNIANCYIWGSQVEEQIYGSSYIKTEGITVTRSEDYNVRTTLSGQTQFDKNKGVVFIDVNPLELNTGQTSSISLQDGSYNMLSFDFKPNNILNFFINNAPAPGAVSYDYSHSGGRIKAAILWSNGRYRLFANGQLLNSYNTSLEFSQLNSFQFNSYFGTYDFQGKIYGIQVFDELLSDAEIKKMTEL